jgi:hypothetical protein
MFENKIKLYIHNNKNRNGFPKISLTYAYFCSYNTNYHSLTYLKMRQITTLVHLEMQITLFSWNQKYLLKFEKGVLEQTYKIPEMDVSGLEEIKLLTQNELFLKKIQQRFEEMQEDLHQVLETLY